jgi:hypothetical protein
MAVNHMADKSELELKALRGKQFTGGYNGGQPFPYENPSLVDVPDNMDWRLYGAVTPVKDQSVCGSCWSFGTTGAIEGAYFVKYGHLIRISQQVRHKYFLLYNFYLKICLGFDRLQLGLWKQRVRRRRRFPLVPVDDEARWHSHRGRVRTLFGTGTAKQKISSRGFD